ERVVPRDLAVVVGVEVEEAGGDDGTVGVDLVSSAPVDRSDLDDRVAVERDVAGERRRAGAVDDGAASNHDVEHGHAPRVVRRLRAAIGSRAGSSNASSAETRSPGGGENRQITEMRASQCASATGSSRRMWPSFIASASSGALTSAWRSIASSRSRVTNRPAQSESLSSLRIIGWRRLVSIDSATNTVICRGPSIP